MCIAHKRQCQRAGRVLGLASGDSNGSRVASTESANCRGGEERRTVSYGQTGYGLMAPGRTLASTEKWGPIAGF